MTARCLKPLSFMSNTFYMLQSFSNIVFEHLEAKLNWCGLLDADYPVLRTDGLVCVGLSIDWTKSQLLYDIALQHTHAEEHSRAARFRREQDRLRHLVGRMLLRSLAMRYGNLPTDAIIKCNAAGKPEPVAPPLGCNLSHSGNQVWAAIAHFPNVGIDVESAVAPGGYRDIIASFHPDEIAAIKMTGDESMAMMRCWSRKEAVSKAIGLGLGLPLNSFVVDCCGKSYDWLRVAPPPSHASKWTTIDLPVDPNYVGALAIEGHCMHVTSIKICI